MRFLRLKPSSKSEHEVSLRGRQLRCSRLPLRLASCSPRLPSPRVRGRFTRLSPYVSIKDEPPPKLIVDPPLPNLLDQGVVWIQYRVENVRIVPVFGASALNVAPRIGHLHIHFDDLPWLWADASGINTIDLAGVPAGQHKVLIELVDANHHAFPGQAKTVTFTVRGTAPR